MSFGKLYLVPTPIGNLGDMTIRGIEVLKSVDLILAEDTRVTGGLLKHFEIGTPCKSFHTHNEHHKTEEVITKLKEGYSIAQVSDAGTPGISDPGFLLVRKALQYEIEVEALPGPTAAIPAILKSGFPCDRFVFEGFLPHKKGRVSRLEALKDEKRTVIFYESPHRILKLLEQILEVLGDREVSVSRELTKKFEETINGTASEVLSFYKEKTIKGEFVVVIKGI